MDNDLEVIMLSILFFNLICLIFLRQKRIIPMLFFSFILDIYTFSFIGFTAFFILLLTDFFKLNDNFVYCFFITLLFNFIICYSIDLHTIILYGYSSIHFTTLLTIYLLICSTIFTNIFQKNI